MDNLQRYLNEEGIEITEAQLHQFSTLLAELITYNEVTNLTAITKPEDIETKHFIDSASVMPFIPATANNLIDIGTGAGFPGLPIKILRPNIDVILVDASSKKVTFHHHIIAKLELTGITSIHARAEEIGHNPAHREQYDVVTARAVAHLATLCEYTLPLLKVGGLLIAQKIATKEEVEASRQALAVLGGVLIRTVPISIPTLEERHIILIQKVHSTPAQYPRRIGVPLKKPL